VRTLIDGELEPGYYTARWDGRNRNGQRAVAGVYVCRLVTATFSANRKVVLLR